MRERFPNNAGYPVVYRPSIGWQVFIYLACGAALAGGAIGLWNLAHGNGTGEANGDTFLRWMCIAFVVFGLFGMLYTALFKVVLEAESITLSTLFGSRTLRRNEIAGFRELAMQHGPPLLVFESKDRFLKPVKMSQVVQTDARFVQWMAGLTNLDTAAQAQAQAEVLADQELGTTPAERMQSVTRARRIAKTLDTAAILIGIWAFFDHQLVAATLLAALPFVGVALFAFSRGQYRLDTTKNDVKPNIGILFIAPAMVLGLRAMIEVELLHWQDGVQMAALGFVTFAVLLNLALRGNGEKLGLIVLVALVMGAYGYGVGTLADAAFDDAPPTQFQSKVLDKYVTSGNHPEYHLQLAAWGSLTEPDDLAVKSPVFDSFARGDTACIALHKGALGAAWYAVGPCH